MSYEYIAITKEWRDKVNGNNYFSSVVEDLSGNIVLKVPFQYGYGTQSEYEIRKGLAETFSKGYHDDNYTREILAKVLSIKFIKIDRCTKKEVKSHAEEL